MDNPENLLPIINECLDCLRKSNIPATDLMSRGAEHYFMGFGLWFRNRFFHASSSATLSFLFDCPDSASAFFIKLIGEHGECTESEWLDILGNTEIPQPVFRKTIPWIIPSDDEL